ncbi:MAG: ROK family protein [Anaerolineaceae bacterium]|nr:ROK family protein [Anaerolineaceae bacterium]
MNASDLALVFDFGGTKLAAAIIEVKTGSIIKEERTTTPATQGAEACVQSMLKLGDSLNDGQQFRGIGISFGGPVTRDRQHCVKSQHVAGWDNYPLTQTFKEHYQLPAAMDNDANLAALGSWVYDAHLEPDNFLYIQASTGIGGGLLLGRKLYRGAGIAGEFGHFTVEGNQHACVCGNIGCMETICAGWGITKQAKEILSTSNPHPFWKNIPSDQITAKNVFDSIRAGDDAMKIMINEAFTHFGVALSNAVALVGVEQVILGGGIFQSSDILAPIVVPPVDQNLPPYMKGSCQISFSTLAGRETLLGAALLTSKKYS